MLFEQASNLAKSRGETIESVIDQAVAIYLRSQSLEIQDFSSQNTSTRKLSYMLATLLGIGLLAQCAMITKLYKEDQALRKRLSRYGGIASKESFLLELDEDIRSRETYVSKLLEEEKVAEIRWEAVRTKNQDLDEKNHLESLGYYEPMYDFHVSKDYKMRFDQISRLA